MRARFTALVVLAAALACGDEDPPTPLAPSDGSSDVTTESAPVDGTFAVRVFYPGATCETELVGSGDPLTFTLPTEEGTFCIKVEAISPPDSDGTVVLSSCALPRGQTVGGSTHTSSTSCTERGGGGRWFRIESLSGTGEWIFSESLPIVPRTRGFRAQYRGMGSGVKNVTLPPFDVLRPAE